MILNIPVKLQYFFHTKHSAFQGFLIVDNDAGTHKLFVKFKTFVYP